jgi:hypothetical protein
VDISLEVALDLKIRDRSNGNALTICPVCQCHDCGMNFNKMLFHCFHCFVPQTKVWCLDGIKNISNVSVDDYVLSDNGTFNRVLLTHKIPYSGNTVIIKSKNLLEDIECDPNHPFVVVRYYKRYNDTKRINWAKQNEFFIEEVEAKNLLPGDWLLYPISNYSNHCDTIKTAEYTEGKKLLPNNLKITDELLRIAGLYIAEGSAYRGGIQFSFSSKERQFANEVKQYFESMNLYVSEIKGYKSSQLVLKISNTHLQKTFEEWFGKGCENKKIPNDLLYLPNNKTSILLSAIWDGDAWQDVLGQTSCVLSYQVWQLRARLGAVSVRKYKFKNKKPVFVVYSKNAVKNTLRDYSHIFSTWFNPIEIDEVKTSYFDGFLHDLTIDKSNKYTVNGILVHNCNAAGRILSNGVYIAKESEPERVLDIPKVRSIYTSLAESYHKHLTPAAREYLNKRGFTDDTIDKFKLGFCGADFYEEYADKLAEDAGIINQNYPILTNRITIPYIVKNEVTDIRGRILDTLSYKENTPKYISLLGSRVFRGSVFLFNHDLIESNDQLIITEGEFKAIAGVQHGFPVLATPGIFGWNHDWNVLFKNKAVVIAADFDGFAGSKSPAYLMAKMLSKELNNLKVASLYSSLNDKKIDIDSLLLTDPKRFDNAIKGAIGIDTWFRLEERKGHGHRRK